MYLIIGGDGKEYGPASAEQIRQWVAGGRANGDTRAKLVGAAEWKPLRDIPEIAGTETVPSYNTPPGAIPPAFAPAMRPFDPLDAFSRGWSVIRADLATIVGATLLTGFIAFAASALLNV